MPQNLALPPPQSEFAAAASASGISVVKFTAGQVIPNTKWPAVQISFLKRIKSKY